MNAYRPIRAFVFHGFLLFAFTSVCWGLGRPPYAAFEDGEGFFPLAGDAVTATLCVDAEDYAGVVRAVGDLQADIERVTGRRPTIVHEAGQAIPAAVLIGTIGKSRIIDGLIAAGKIDVSDVRGKRESFVIQTVSDPMKGVESGLVIAGSDKRGTIYGLYDLSEQIGVSPWYWWADVRVRKRERLYIKAGRIVQGEPPVEYRGIFLNDEAPALSGWVHEKFGGYNHAFYTKVFELLLRLKANFLWPAMWDNSFNTDDPLNPKLADEWGIVMSTSHHEPMMRAWKEWGRAGHGEGTWDYSKNPETLRAFWREGLERTKDYEKIITLAMRGDGDEPMSEAANVALLEKIVADQRQIIAEVIDPDVTKVPQVWALYKEVQGYYERGMRVPDDVTLLWCDDNWGNIRRLPTAEERRRSGGAGIYYHFDYVGGPRSYRWLNTNPIPKIWEQMNLAYRYGANRIWIVNVGDLKPMEFPIEFFLRMAWNPDEWPKERLGEFARLWAQREFGPEYADQIAAIVSKYGKYNGRRKPEQLEPDTFSLIHYREAQRVLTEWRDITAQAEAIYQKLPDESKDAYYQLVLHPVRACGNLTEMYVTVGLNRLYARQGRASTNDLANKARELFERDAELSRYYNREMAGGKWNHMMDQTHIGYTSWDNPPKNIMPEVRESEPAEEARMGVAVEGSEQAWPGGEAAPALAEFSVFGQQERFVDVFNRGRMPFEFAARASEPWIVLSETQGTVDKEHRLRVSVDWKKAPLGRSKGSIMISGGGEEIVVAVSVFHPAAPSRATLDGFAEADGYVSIEPEHYTGRTDAGSVRWEKIDDYGRTLSGMTIFPVTAESRRPGKDSPCLEYRMYLFNPGKVEVQTVLGPALNFDPARDVRLGVSFDDQPPQVLTVVPKDYEAGSWDNDWADAVSRNARVVTSTHILPDAGYHTLKVWMVDPAVVLQKIIVDTGGLASGYLRPPESCFNRYAGAWRSGAYRNLFAEIGKSPEEVAAKINGAFEQLFYGDRESQAVYFPAGRNKNGPMAVIKDINNGDVRSEGMSYGMMIAVQLDRKAAFDALWNWAKTYMYHDSPKHPARGFFSWSMNPDGTPRDEMPAPDGEEYFATALYFAAGRWGSGEGIYDYRREAECLLKDMKNRTPITGPTVTGERTAGNLFDPETKMVRFTPDLENQSRSDPSYHLPAFYELWALWGPEADRPFWAEAARASRDFLERAAHPVTALTPEYSNFDGSPWAAPWRKDSIHFQFDAWRTGMNWAFDRAWWAADERARVRSDRLQAFFESRGIDSYGGQYTLAGEPFGQKHSTGLAAANATVSLASTHPRSRRFVEALWEAPVPTGRYRYYDGMLYLMGLLHCGGQFRIWPPVETPR